MKSLLKLMACGLAFGLTACNSNQNQSMEDKALNMADLDTTVSASADFYAYATGGWQKNNPLPNDKSRYGSFDILGEETDKKVNTLIQDLAKQQNEENSVEWKIATLYNLGMDEAKLNADGISPIKPMLDEIDAMTDKAQIVDMVAKMHHQGVSAFFGVFGTSDPENSDLNIPWYYQGGLGLANKEYYTDEGEREDAIRQQYVEHVGKMFALIGYSEEDAKAAAKNVFEIEDQLANVSMGSVEERDPFKTTNKMTVDEMSAKSPNFDIAKYFELQGITVKENINVCQPLFLEGVSQIIEKQSLDNLKQYLKWNVVNSSASYLSEDLNKQNFEFYGKTLSGVPVQQDRWKRVVRVVNGNLGECVGEIFVQKYFPPEAKERMITLVENLRSAFGERIKNLDWMSEETKAKALEKLAAITVKIGYPDKWKDYSKLQLKEDSYYANVLRCNEFEFEDMVSKIGKPVDKTEWMMTPQTVNAYYSPNTNEICFPAGILQPPFFYMDADDAVNYGAIGVVIGHEMTHGFDDQGRNFDKEGNLACWWTEEDAAKFTERAKVLIDRYNSIVVIDTLHANGEYSLGENIADYGGLKISFDAFKKASEGKEQPTINGFTPEQRFYLSYAKVWANNIRDEEIIRRTKEDVHSLGKWRVNGQLIGIDDFHKAFGIKEGDAMYIPESEWAKIW